jgi:hypothetical protein
MKEFRLRVFKNRALLRKILWSKKDEVTWECRKTFVVCIHHQLLFRP